ncbi:hydroxymethylglutaryl-CoA lyase [Xanthobacter sp. KR7-225]|uniref:hydroxymethylglutaryl-CoA lyase n=1 Tax=Xanthobacter sp. KR7-225 TaxID=3156613 RepID=UPI0032B52BEC
MPPHTVEIVEVAPRDGLQNEQVQVSTPIKAELVRRAVEAGLRRVEVTSFVNPQRVPQMADAEALMQNVRTYPDLISIGLAMNRRGFDRARAAGCNEVNMVVVASESLGRRNQGMSTAESIAIVREVGAAAREAGLPMSVTIAASFGCPFEGEVPEARVLAIMEQILPEAPLEIAFADTIGCGVPAQVTSLLKQANALAPGMRLRCHFHNTRNTGLANVAAAVAAGARAIDASLGGTGGCPFAPGATGNVATEDVAWMLDRMGVSTGVDLDKAVEAAQWLAAALGKQMAGGVAKAGLFPKAVARGGCVAVA